MKLGGTQAVVVVPVGPGDDAVDTIDSVLHYCEPTTEVVAIDDSGGRFTDALRSFGDRVHLVVPSGQYSAGTTGGLLMKLMQGYKYALDNIAFDVLLRIDTDALIIGESPEVHAREYFASNPKVGMLGSYRFDCNGKERDFTPAAERFKREMGPLGLLKPKLRAGLKNTVRQAERNGYALGEHCLGGAYFQNFECVKAMNAAGYLNPIAFSDSLLGDDMIVALFTIAAGFEIADFATGEFPLGLRWRGLPMSPDDLRSTNKKVIHSVRFWDEWDESKVRDYFRQHRAS